MDSYLNKLAAFARDEERRISEMRRADLRLYGVGFIKVTDDGVVRVAPEDVYLAKETDDGTG